MNTLIVCLFAITAVHARTLEPANQDISVMWDEVKRIASECSKSVDNIMGHIPEMKEKLEKEGNMLKKAMLQGELKVMELTCKGLEELRNAIPKAIDKINEWKQQCKEALSRKFSWMPGVKQAPVEEPPKAEQLYVDWKDCWSTVLGGVKTVVNKLRDEEKRLTKIYEEENILEKSKVATEKWICTGVVKLADIIEETTPKVEAKVGELKQKCKEWLAKCVSWIPGSREMIMGSKDIPEEIKPEVAEPELPKELEDTPVEKIE